jgi:hypothetical protein
MIFFEGGSMVVTPFFHCHAISSQKLLDRFIAPPVVKREHSHF